MAGADTAAIFVEAPVEDVVGCLDRPVSAIEGEQPFRRGGLRVQAGDAVGHLATPLAGLAEHMSLVAIGIDGAAQRLSVDGKGAVAAAVDLVPGPQGGIELAGSTRISRLRIADSFVFSGRTINARQITKDLLSGTLHELGGVEANVASGYHAVEFLLWGQDLNGTGPGAGARPASDFDPANCSWGNCDRRADYLKAATDLLVEDLAWMTAQWALGGDAREGLVNGEIEKGLAAILTGMGSLSYGELAGERMKLGLLLNDPEEEHDCFSDNTHYSHCYNALGIRNIYLGEYQRIERFTLWSVRCWTEAPRYGAACTRY